MSVTRRHVKQTEEFLQAGASVRVQIVADKLPSSSLLFEILVFVRCRDIVDALVINTCTNFSMRVGMML
jgi:hypothetical protein